MRRFYRDSRTSRNKETTTKQQSPYLEELNPQGLPHRGICFFCFSSVCVRRLLDFILMISVIKRRLHREICANPILHGLVLNLYLNGEQYPHRVSDYFPIEKTTHTDLAKKMRNHLAQEDKHALMYAAAIQRIGQPVVELALPDIYNHVIRSYTGFDFAIDSQDKPDKRDLKLAHFFAHLHFLEKRIAHSLEIHGDACASSPSDYPGKVISRILSDEMHHVVYTREAVCDLVSTQTARYILAEHARAERQANFKFSAQQLKNLITNHADLFPSSSAWLYRFSCFFLEGALRHV